MKNSKGFTLIELVVVTVIIIIISVVVIVSFQHRQEEFTLQRAAHILAQDIRRAQELAMRAENFQGSVSRGGFGIHITSNTSSYILFADCDGDMAFDATGGAASCVLATTTPGGSFPEQLERREFERGITIITPTSTIVFIPPDPAVRIDGGRTVTSTTITLRVDVGGIGHTRNVIINNAGLIEIR